MQLHTRHFKRSCIHLGPVARMTAKDNIVSQLISNKTYGCLGKGNVVRMGMLYIHYI